MIRTRSRTRTTTGAVVLLLFLTAASACGAASDGAAAGGPDAGIDDAGIDDAGIDGVGIDGRGADGGGPGRDADRVDAGAVPADGQAAPDAPLDVPEPDPYLSRQHRTREIDLGAPAFDEYGYTEEIRFTVPEGTASVFVMVDGEDGVHYVLSLLQAPDDHVLVPNRWDLYGDPTLCLACENRISAGEGTGTFMLPAAPQVAVVPGEYVFTVRGYRLKFTGVFPNIRTSVSPAETPAPVRVLLHEPLSPGSVAFLDLNLHFTGAGGVTAATAPGDPVIEDMLAAIDRAYEAVGIRVGDVRYYDAPEELQTIETMMGEDADLARLFRNSAGKPLALNLFFVDLIFDRSNPMTALGVILGVAGGIPGPPLSPGSPRSGVAIVIDPPFIADSVSVGTIAAHESGHYLGLYHTTEQPLAGSIHDQIEDTPKNSGANLMYYTSDGSDPSLTEGQGFVMRRHALVYNQSWADPNGTGGAE